MPSAKAVSNHSNWRSAPAADLKVFVQASAIAGGGYRAKLSRALSAISHHRQAQAPPMAQPASTSVG